MTYRDVLRQRRLGTGIPADPDTANNTGTGKSPREQGCSLYSHSSHALSETGETAYVETQGWASSLPTPEQIASIINGLKSMGHHLAEVEELARDVMFNMPLKAAAELAAVLDDLFETAPNADTARSQCQLVLSHSVALKAAKSCWPGLSIAPAPNNIRSPIVPQEDHLPRWGPPIPP